MRSLSEKGIAGSEEYQSRISRNELVSELIAKGYSKEAIDEQLEQLCTDGTLAMDEQNVYQYDNPGQ